MQVNRRKTLLILAVVLSIACRRTEALELKSGFGGTVSAWNVAGPFVEQQEVGFDEKGNPSLSGKQPWRFTANLPRALSSIRKRKSPGYIYVHTRLRVPHASTPSMLRVVSSGKPRMWIDGKIARTAVEEGAYGVISLAALQPGRVHSLLLEVKRPFIAVYAPSATVLAPADQPAASLLAEALQPVAVPQHASAGERVVVRWSFPGSYPALKEHFTLTSFVEREDGSKSEISSVKVYVEDVISGTCRIAFTYPAETPMVKVYGEVSFGKARARTAPATAYNPTVILRRMCILEDDLQARGERTAPAAEALELAMEKLHLLLGRKPLPSASAVASAWNETKEALKALKTGRKRRLPTGRVIEMTYRSRIDDSVQPYRLYLPHAYRRDREKLSLIVFLHGYSPDITKACDWWDYLPFSLLWTAERLPAIVAAPFGRGNTDFQGVGEEDVLKVISEAKRHFRIDEDRVFLCGVSMGGSGTWSIAAHHPSLFAGAIPVAGRSDFALWRKRWNEPVPSYAPLFVHGDFAVDLACNFLNLPVFCIHGGSDVVVAPEHSRRMVSRIRRIGGKVIYREMPGRPHVVWEEAFAMEELRTWLGSLRRTKAPRRVTLRTYSPKYGHAYWLGIERITRWTKPAYVDAKIAADGTLRIAAENVSLLRIDPKVIGHITKIVVRGKGEWKPINRNPDGLIEVVPGSSKDIYKSPRLCGPFREIFSGPFIVVYGDTPADKATAQAFGKQWIDFSQGRVTLVPAERVTPEELKENNVVLVGSFVSNPVLRRIRKKIPFHLGADGVKLFGKFFRKGTHNGFIGIYPSPFARNRYVGFIWGRLWGTHLPRNHVWDEVPDFLVFCSCSKGRKEVVDILFCGYFDSDWKTPVITGGIPLSSASHKTR